MKVCGVEEKKSVCGVGEKKKSNGGVLHYDVNGVGGILHDVNRVLLDQ